MKDQHDVPFAELAPATPPSLQHAGLFLLRAVRPHCMRGCGCLHLDGLYKKLHTATWDDQRPTKHHHWAIWSCTKCQEKYYHLDGVFCVGPAHMDLA